MRMKKLAVLAMAAALSVGTVMTASAAWLQEGSNWRYQNDDGSYQAGTWFRDVDGRWYHFDNNGVMQKGWFLDTDGKWYFLAYNGVMQVGLLKVDNQVYYMNPSGDLFLGDMVVNGTTYNFGLYGTTNGQPSVPATATYGGNGNQSLSGGGSSSGGGSDTVTDPVDKVKDTVNTVKEEAKKAENDTVTNITVKEPVKSGNGVVVTVDVKAETVTEDTIDDVKAAITEVVESTVDGMAGDTPVTVSVPGIKNNKEFTVEELLSGKLDTLVKTYVSVEFYNDHKDDKVTVVVPVNGVDVTYTISLK